MRAPATDRDAEQAQALVARLFTAGLGAAELFAAYLGMRLGLYERLRSEGPCTADQLAQGAGIAPRYAAEWLEQQAASGMVEVDDAHKPREARLYLLPAGHAEALVDCDSPFCIAPMVLLPVSGVARVLPRLLEAYRSGGGVPYSAYGDDFLSGQGMLNRAAFRYALPACIQAALPDVHARLAAGEIRVADVACGAGWSSIELARAYPRIHIDGFDAYAPVVEEATRQAEAAGVSDRVTFRVEDARRIGGTACYGLVCIFDALHDMAQPVEVLRACRSRLVEGGTMLLMEPRTAESFEAPAGEVERFFYSVSLLHCLPVGMSEQPSAAIGTVIRPETVRKYAAAAGFSDAQPLPFEHRFHRFYRLVK